jgi:hypothetical protein
MLLSSKKWYFWSLKTKNTQAGSIKGMRSITGDAASKKEEFSNAVHLFVILFGFLP